MINEISGSNVWEVGDEDPPREAREGFLVVPYNDSCVRACALTHTFPVGKDFILNYDPGAFSFVRDFYPNNRKSNSYNKVH